jgi:hypothetical protein
MASTAPRRPEQYKPPRSSADLDIGEFHVSELAASIAGSLSPFGQDVEFPLPVEKLRYTHPESSARPNLADGR